ncbi:MAG: FG-GAP-like repeat-containing protein [Puniceicoccaceae bacterium]
MKIQKYFLLLTILPWFQTLPAAPDSEWHSRPLEWMTSGDATLFTAISPEVSGLALINSYADPNMWGERYQEFQGGAIGTGLAVADVDGDGWLDLYVVNKFGPNALYRQTGPLVFEEITDTAGVAGHLDAWCTGVSFADVNNDGRPDLYVCYVNAPNRLYMNLGGGRFEERSEDAGLGIVSGSVVGAFADYDRDGHLDLFLVANLADAARSPKGEPNRLFRNDGTGHFMDVTEQSGILLEAANTHTATWWDANGDGWPDLYVSNDFELPDRFYLNNGDGTFTEVSESAIPHTPWYSMGADFCDFNNDGHFDFFAADMANTTHYKSKVAMGDMGGLVDYMDTLVTPQYMVNAFYINTDSPHFMEGARLLGVSSTDWTWSPRFEDLDNDGWQDLFVTNGMVRSFNDSDILNRIKRASSAREIIAMVRNSPQLKEDNLAFRNTGEWKFKKVTGDWGLKDFGTSFGSVLCDLDNDGDVDIVYANYDGTVSLYRNNSTSNRITIDLEGVSSNRCGVGAQVFAQTSTGLQSREVAVVRGALSSSGTRVHFGLGNDERVEKLTIRWPSGSVQHFTDLPANQAYHIREQHTPERCEASSPSLQLQARFTEVSEESGLSFENREALFNDMIRQSLLPNRMNTLGGGMAWGDANGDGLHDLYFAGAKGQVGQLYLNQGNGTFRLDSQTQPWNLKVETEEMSAVWVDANSDGAMDLYVTSGGVECEAEDVILVDSLYLNDGTGRFREVSADTLPAVASSTSVVIAADYDQDGQMELFVGGRVVPGVYPEIPRSMLLKQVDGRWVDVTAKMAPGLEKIGMVTGALWSDTDGDGWLDLVLVGEWQPLRVFRNVEGVLEQVSQEGLVDIDSHGWWNGLVAADVNNDGHMDYIATNFGQNTKYHPGQDKPVDLYFGDFEGRGTKEIVEAKYEGDCLYPVRGRSCSSRAMPSLKREFPTYKAWGRALLEEIYDLDVAERRYVKTIDHGVFVNRGDGSFRFKPLPWVSQIAPGFGLVAQDFDGDGFVDLVVGHNFRGPQVETGRFDGGHSCFLRGNGDGTFEQLDWKQSGILIPEEVRSISVADLNGTGWPDLVIGRVNERVLVYQNSTVGGNSFAVKLDAPQHLKVGARLTVRFSDSSMRVSELFAGEGYLTQSQPLLFVGYRLESPPTHLELRWADRTITEVTLDQPLSILTITR